MVADGDVGKFPGILVGGQELSLSYIVDKIPESTVQTGNWTRMNHME